jgi:hypothetical protein
MSVVVLERKNANMSRKQAEVRGGKINPFQ